MGLRLLDTGQAAVFSLVASLLVGLSLPVLAQDRTPPAVTDYVVGPQDVLTITSYDQTDLSGKFALEADGTFTYPLIGRVKAGGTTLRQVEMRVKQQMKDMG